MSGRFPEVYLVRHGETEWSVTGQHTGKSDIPLTSDGEQAARNLGNRLHGVRFSRVWSSPSQRAIRSSALAGFEPICRTKGDLAEWDYGDYEGRTTKQILSEYPGWNLFRDGCPQGETARDVGARADCIIAEIRQINDTVLIFSSAHILRVIAARWLGLPPESGACFILDTASISVVGYEHNLTEPVIRNWNQR